MNPNLKLAPRTFAARVAELGFTTTLPTDWISHELPREDVDFSNPTTLLPLAIVTAPHAAIIFAFAARPAYDDGTLHDWAWYLLNHNNLKPRAIGPSQVAGVTAIVGEARQESELGPLVVRFAFFEDGNRVVNLTLTAPEIFADSVRDAWFAMLQSFTLETPRGSRFKTEGDSIPAPATPEASAETESATNSSTESAVPVREIAMKLPENLKPKKCKFFDFALAADTASLDPEHSINTNLRDRGVGLVPNVVAVRTEARYARVAAGAVIGEFDVPFGWHVIDDGKRTLVFEPSGNVQINLNLMPREGRSNKAILDAIEAETRNEYPHPEFIRLKEGRIHALGARNIADGDQPLEQYHLLYPFRDDSMVLRARVTATPDQASDSCNLAEMILDSIAFDCFQQRDEPKPTAPKSPREAHRAAQKSSGPPQWWHEALAFEAQDQLDAAEKHIRDNCPYIGFAASTAEMYRRRMLRLKNAGDETGARAAFKKSSDFIFLYASMATSGGEGAALSYERDQFLTTLTREFGYDPTDPKL